jgi:3-phosphoshikimate 1-carboxyvinyltransferase
MPAVVHPPRLLRGTLAPPGDKSISHRAAIFNAIAHGEAVIEDIQRGADVLATLRCLERLGIHYEWQGETSLYVVGGSHNGLREPPSALDCRNSGTTMRLLAGLLSPQPFFSVLTGDASLRSRPMDRVIQPLRRMGADIRGRQGDSRAPLAISGRPLIGIRYRIPVASAQVKSALILAALFAEGETFLEEAAPTRDHSERLLKAMGADIEAGEGLIRVRPLAGDLRPLPLSVPGDISGAAPWLVATALHPQAEVRLEGVGVNPSRSGVLDALGLMGADIRLENQRLQGPEPIADIVVRSSHLRGAIIEGDLIPRAIDELPLLALAGCLARGETVIRDASELRVKESDRIRTTVQELQRLGADIQEMAGGMRIRGIPGLHGATVSSHGDHRLAILLVMAGLLAQGQTVIRNSQAVAVSYPWFWHDMQRLTAGRQASEPGRRHR